MPDQLKQPSAFLGARSIETRGPCRPLEEALGPRGQPGQANTSKEPLTTVCPSSSCPVPIYSPRPPEPPSTTTASLKLPLAFVLLLQVLRIQEVPQRNECSNMILTWGKGLTHPSHPPSTQLWPLCPLLHPLPYTEQRLASFTSCPGALVQDTTCTTFHGTAQPGLTSLPNKDSQRGPGHPNIKNGTQRPGYPICGRDYSDRTVVQALTFVAGKCSKNSVSKERRNSPFPVVTNPTNVSGG